MFIYYYRVLRPCPICEHYPGYFSGMRKKVWMGGKEEETRPRQASDPGTHASYNDVCQEPQDQHEEQRRRRVMDDIQPRVGGCTKNVVLWRQKVGLGQEHGLGQPCVRALYVPYIAARMMPHIPRSRLATSRR